MPGNDHCRVLFRPQQFANHIIGIGRTLLRSDHARELRPSGFLHDSEVCLEAETTLETEHGRIAVRWQLVDGVLTVDAELPDGVDGVLRLPGQDDRAFADGKLSVIVPFGPSARTPE